MATTIRDPQRLLPRWLQVTVIVILLLFGAKKLPELAKGLGQGISNFKKGLKEADEDDKPKKAEKAEKAAAKDEDDDDKKEDVKKEKLKEA